MPDTIPSFDELLAVARKACEAANLPWWDEEARATLTAVLPLVTGPAAIDFDQSLRQWKMYAEMYDDDGDLSTGTYPEAQLYRRARTTLAGLKALAKGGPQ